MLGFHLFQEEQYQLKKCVSTVLIYEGSEAKSTCSAASSQHIRKQQLGH